MPVTLQDIADRLGVSIATVSRALGGAEGVSEAMRARARVVADEMGYHPNVMARRLQKQRADAIGFVIPTFGPRFSDPFFSELLAGVGNEAAEHEMDLLVSTRAPGGEDELRGYERLVKDRRVDGLLVVRTRSQDQRVLYLAEHDFPFVAFGRSDLDIEFPYLDVDGESGMRELTEHLIARGHRRIAYINAPPKFMFARHRFQGYRQALTAHDISFDDSLVISSCLSDTCGYEAGKTLLGHFAPPTAIIACTDLMALGVIGAVHECGLQVGKDIAVAGFDGIPLTEMVRPPLTTVRQPIYQIGRQICSMLLRLLDDKQLKNPHVLLSPELLLRQSTDFDLTES